MDAPDTVTEATQLLAAQGYGATITLKRLGLYFNPIILLDTMDYWQPLDAFLHQVIAQRFLNPEHRRLWSLVARPEDVLPGIATAPCWGDDARALAAVRPDTGIPAPQ